MRAVFGAIVLVVIVLELHHQFTHREQMAMLTVASGQGTLYFGGWPPARFSNSPRQPVTIRFAQDQAEINARCGAAPAGLRTEACASVGKPSITMPNPCTYPEGYAQILCHEIGHVNGWPNNHPR